MDIQLGEVKPSAGTTVVLRHVVGGVSARPREQRAYPLPQPRHRSRRPWPRCGSRRP